MAADLTAGSTKPGTTADIKTGGRGGTWWAVSDPSQRQEPGHPNSEILNQPGRPQGHEFVYGPYRTKAEADARLKEIRSPITPPSIPNPLSGIGSVGHWIGLFVQRLTDGAMWRSIGWLILGAWLVIAGIYLWFRTSSTYKGIESSITGTLKAL